MIAASFLQILLAVGVFLGSIGLVIGILAFAIDFLYLEQGYSGWWVAPAAFAAEILVIATFIWLGSGPLNG